MGDSEDRRYILDYRKFHYKEVHGVDAPEGTFDKEIEQLHPDAVTVMATKIRENLAKGQGKYRGSVGQNSIGGGPRPLAGS